MFFMKFILLYLAILFGLPLFAQREQPNRYEKLPYNSFISLPDLDWACEIFSEHDFDSGKKEQFDIHSYLMKAQVKGEIKSYRSIDYPYWEIKTEGKKIDDYFFEMPKECNEKPDVMRDSGRTVEFQEIFYYKDHRLYSHIVSAAPLFKVFTANGWYVGNSTTSLSSLNYYPGTKKDRSDEVIYLGDTHSILDFDSIERRSFLKKNYGMTLSLLLWHDLSLGFNEAVDLKDGRVVPANEIMMTSPFDSIEYFSGIDTVPAIMQKMPAPPVFQSFTDIEIQQSWYYNKTKDVFFDKIVKLYIYAWNGDPKSFLWNNQRRYEVIFK